VVLEKSMASLIVKIVSPEFIQKSKNKHKNFMKKNLNENEKHVMGAAKQFLVSVLMSVESFFTQLASSAKLAKLPLTVHADAGISMVMSIVVNVLTNFPQTKTNQGKNALHVAKYYLVIALKLWKRCFTKSVSRVLFVKKVLKRHINTMERLGMRFIVLIATRIDLGLVLIVVFEKRVVSIVADVVHNFGRLFEI